MSKIGPDICPLYIQKAFLLAGCVDCLQCCATDADMRARRSAAARCAASAQLSNWLGLVSGVASSMTDSKAIDAQYGAEKGVTALAAALSGANMIYESAGMTAALLGVSFEGFVLDNDMLGNIYRMLRGVEVTDENLGFEVIVEAVQGEGHFLGHPQTMAAMERDYFYPETADREAPMTWRERGSMDAQTRAKAKARFVAAASDLFVGPSRCPYSRGLRHPTATPEIGLFDCGPAEHGVDPAFGLGCFGEAKKGGAFTVEHILLCNLQRSIGGGVDHDGRDFHGRGFIVRFEPALCQAIGHEGVHFCKDGLPWQGHFW